jgi:hypothetical protein
VRCELWGVGEEVENGRARRTDRGDKNASSGWRGAKRVVCLSISWLGRRPRCRPPVPRWRHPAKFGASMRAAIVGRPATGVPTWSIRVWRGHAHEPPGSFKTRCCKNLAVTGLHYLGLWAPTRLFSDISIKVNDKILHNAIKWHIVVSEHYQQISNDRWVNWYKDLTLQPTTTMLHLLNVDERLHKLSPLLSFDLVLWGITRYRDIFTLPHVFVST